MSFSQNFKAITKNSIRWIPVIGWNWFLSEYIFLERNWKRDLLNFGKSLDKIMSYEDPISLFLMPEGTRFTKSKFEASIQFAKQRGLPLLKYHLLPRVKGFAFCIRHIKQYYPETVLCDIQIKFPKDMKDEPTITSILEGKPLNADLYLRKIPLSEVPTDTEEDISKFMYNLYHKKDQLMECHDLNGTFPGIRVQYPRRLAPLINWMGWFIIITVSLIYIMWYIFISGNWYLLISTFCLLVFGLICIYLIISSTQIKKASKYGITQNIEIKKE
jgi:lysophosphatidic acid acyltransferase/lysophosphatidylinositol acyltransferase